jgi:acyl carrier protein
MTEGEPVPQEVLDTVGGLIAEVIGEDVAADRKIAMETSFSDDLELESIEFVALAEKLQHRYGKSVDFARWLSAMELDQILALKVGDLVQYIVRCRS